MTKRIYAIADSHGQIAMLHRALDLIEADGRRDEEIMFLGDYVDRGPDSKAVLDLLIEGDRPFKRTCSFGACSAASFRRER